MSTATTTTNPENNEGNSITINDSTSKTQAQLFQLPKSITCQEETTERKCFSMVFLQNEETQEVLLGLKKRGFGQNLWGGFGGKIEEGETIVEAAIREVYEECGLRLNLSDLDQIAIIFFQFLDSPIILQVHVFICHQFNGQLSESDEMIPKWFKLSEIPYEQMWPDAAIWYPLILVGGQPIRVKFTAHFQLESAATTGGGGGGGCVISYVIKDAQDETKILKQQ